MSCFSVHQRDQRRAAGSSHVRSGRLSSLPCRCIALTRCAIQRGLVEP
jgi:hypothetical protein